MEQRDDPSLRGRPVVVAWKGKRSVVCAASYEARKFGVRSAMPAITAERLCPEAIFVPPDFVRYKEASRAAREIFQCHTDLIEPLSLDEAYLDVTKNKTGLPTATRVAKVIRQQIQEELRLRRQLESPRTSFWRRLRRTGANQMACLLSSLTRCRSSCFRFRWAASLAWGRLPRAG